MRRIGRRHKLLWFLALAVLGLLLAPFVAVQIQERIFRHRAEQLLADMRTLMLHKANLAEMQTVLSRWSPDSGCIEQDCGLQVDISYGPFVLFLDHRPVAEINVLPRRQSKLWLVPFRLCGGRLAHVRAHARVERGVLYWIDYQIDLEVSARPDDGIAMETQQHYMQYILSAAARYDWRFSLPADWHGLTLHPDYFIEQGAPQRSEVYPPSILAELGPGANPGDVSRLANFNFSCLTRLEPCRKPEDLMPQAAAQFAREEPQLAQARQLQICGPDMLRLMARDAGRAGVVEVIGSHSEPHFSEVPVPIVRLIQDFKPARGWEAGETRELLILDSNTGLAVRSLPPEVRPGNRFIMLAEPYLLFDRLAETYSCGVAPLTPTNLDLVRNAIERAR